MLPRIRRAPRPIGSAVGRTDSERGSALLELTLAAPVMLALAGAIIDGGWALHQAALVTAAAEAAQRAVAILDTGAGNCAGPPPAAYSGVAGAAAAAAAPTLDPSRLSVTVSYVEPACVGRMRTLVVDMTYALSVLTPWFTPLLNGRSLTAEAGSAVEETPPPWWGSAAQVQADEAEIASQQAEIASLTSAYQSMVSAYQSLSSAYQAEVSLASSLSQTVDYYYALWQQILAAQGSGGAGGEHDGGGGG